MECISLLFTCRVYLLPPVSFLWGNFCLKTNTLYEIQLRLFCGQITLYILRPTHSNQTPLPHTTTTNFVLMIKDSFTPIVSLHTIIYWWCLPFFCSYAFLLVSIYCIYWDYSLAEILINTFRIITQNIQPFVFLLNVNSHSIWSGFWTHCLHSQHWHNPHSLQTFRD